MKKQLLILIIFIVLLILSSCSLLKFLPQFESRIDSINRIDKSERGIAKSRLLEILDALENKDANALKNMLSEEALEKAENLDEGIESFIEAYHGTYIEYKINTPSSGGRYDKGKCIEYYISVTIQITTEVDTYWIVFYDQTICEENPEKVGLRSLQIVRESEKRSWSGAYGIYELIGKIQEETDKESS